MAIGENFDATFRPRFWDDPVYSHQEEIEPLSFFMYLHWDHPWLRETAISDVYVKKIVKPWISKMEITVTTCNRTLHDDMVQLNKLRRSERQFTKYSNLLKRHTVECDDILLDIVRALRNLKHAWDKLYDKFENPVLKYYMLKNVLMSDIEHCFYPNCAPYQLIMMHRLKDKVKLFTSLHEELFKQSDHLHKCFLRQGMQAVHDKLDILEFLNKGILSHPMKEMQRMTERSLMIDWSEVFDIQEGKQRLYCSPLQQMVLREVSLTSMDFLDLCFPVKRHLSILIEVGTTSETLSTPSFCRTEPVFCLVAENSSTETRFWNFQLPSKIKERGLYFAGRFHRLKYDKALGTVLVPLVLCLLCIPTCTAMDVDSEADHLSQLFIWDRIKDLYVEHGRYLMFTLEKTSLEDIYKQCTGKCYYISRYEHQSSVYAFEESKTRTLEEDYDFGIYFLHKKQETCKRSWLDGKTDVWLCINKCTTRCSPAQCLLLDGIKDVYIEDGCQLMIILKKPSLENFYKQWTGICYYILCRQTNENFVDAHKSVVVLLKENKTHTFEEDCDFDKQRTGICYYICRHEHQSSVYAFKENKTDTFEQDCVFGIYFLHIEQENRKSRLPDDKIANKCKTICSPAQCLQQDGIKDVHIEDILHLLFTPKGTTLEDFYKQWIGKRYYINRHIHKNLISVIKSMFIYIKDNVTHTFEEDFDFDNYSLRMEQGSGVSSWFNCKTGVWLCTNKCGKLFSSVQSLLQGFRQVVDKIMQECKQNQLDSYLEITNRTINFISLKPNYDERPKDSEEKMKMPKSSDVFNTKLIVWIAIIALSKMKLFVFCAWIAIKHVKLKCQNPITWIICKKHSPTTPDLAWFRGNSKLSEGHRYKSIEVQKEVACLKKPVQEQTKPPETKSTVSIDTVCPESSEKFYSLSEKYVAPLLSVDVSLEVSSEILITTQSIEADPNLELVYDKHCEIEIRKFTENKGIRNELHTQDEHTRNFHANKELEKSKSVPKVVDACNDLSSARNSGDESFHDLKWKSKLQLKVHPDLPSERSIYLPDNTVIKEDSGSPTAKFVKDVDFDRLSAKKENPGCRRKGVDSTFSEKEFDQIRLQRDLTWLPLNHLPVPKIEIIVGFVPDFPPLMAIIDLIAIGKPPAPHVSMRYELLRFCTLRSYPKDDKPYLIKLAEAGFYYASDGDGVVCYCCGIRRYNWTADDKPMTIHRRINPTCKFLTKNDEVNVKNEFNGPFSKSLLYIDNILEPRESQEPSEDINNDWAPERTRSPAPRPQSSQNAQSSSQLGINTAIPKHSQYATKPARIASYNGWPDSASHSPDELADAGFFYAGFGDCVRCFYCGIGLRHWTQDDNPWIEHARWAKNCVFVKQKKGDEFVNLVQLAVQYSQDNASQENETANQLSPREIENYLLSDASQSVLEMGYQPRIIKKAIENILRQNRQTEITAQFLMEQVLELEEAGNSIQAAPSPGSPADRVAHVGPTEGASASAPKESSNVKCNDEESGNATQKPIAKEKKKEEKKTSKKTNDKDKEIGSNASIAQDPKAIKAENEQLKEQTLCKICLDQTVCIVFLPCGHLVTCADCAPAMRKCPICRALVQGTVRTYMS